MMLFRYRTLGYSIAFHAFLIAALSFLVLHLDKQPNKSSKIAIQLHNKSSNLSLRADKKSGSQGSHRLAPGKSPSKKSYPLDLRPSFAKNLGGLPSGLHSENSESQHGTESNRDAEDLLHADGKSLQAFDHLAFLINGHLDYPELLAENGVQGLASLDLYFDHDARIDEARTRMTGDNRWIRGLFVRAARIGITEWFQSLGGRLDKNQFRDQHFRADFVITYTDTRLNDLKKNGEGSYHLVRKRLVQTCLNPMQGGLDLACTAMRVAGMINSKVSQSYKIKFQALKDRLEQFDELGLSGLNQEALHRSET